MKNKEFVEYEELIVVSEKMYEEVVKNIDELKSLKKIYYIKSYEELVKEQKGLNDSKMN